MQTVFPSKSLPHIWANQKAPRGRSSSALSFDGLTIRSYATWVGQIVPGTKGRKAFLVNSTRYSNTTAKHQSAVRLAIPSEAPQFPVWDVPRGHGSFHYLGVGVEKMGKELVSQYVEKASDLAASAETARQPKKDRLRGEASELMALAQKAAEFFGVRVKIDEKTLKRLADAKARANRRALKAQREARERALREHSESLRRWQANETNETPTHLEGRTYLRVRGEYVETSRGILLSKDQATRAITFARNKLAEYPSGWQLNGLSVELISDSTGTRWAIDRVSKEGIEAGCHRISWAEIDRLAAQLSSL